MAQGYIIHVGAEKPAEAIVAQADKQGRPTGEQFRHFIRVGTHLLINASVVWGRRVINGKPPEDGKSIEYTDTRYRGEVEFLKWGADGGSAIECRYLPRSSSLDVLYQNNVQRLQVRDTDAMLELKAGENIFDFKKDALKIKFLQVHAQNQDSKSKNPDPQIKGHTFHEVTDDTIDNRSIKQQEEVIDAGYFVKSLSNKPQSIRNLFDVMGRREEFGSINKLSTDGQIYKCLLDYVDKKPNDFFSLLNDFKKQVSDMFSMAESYKAIDLTKPGHIVWVFDPLKKEMLWTNVKGKGAEMESWVLENCLEADVYPNIGRMKELVSKLK